MFALANVYVAEGNIKKGIANYQRLQRELPNSNLVSKSMLKEGLIYYNKDQSNKAIERFKQVAEKYPKSAEALQAVKTARLVYIDLGKTKAYADWVRTLDFVEITNEELDNTTYEAAEKPYLENNTSKAIPNFETYLEQFPNGLHSLKAQFYVAYLARLEKEADFQQNIIFAKTNLMKSYNEEKQYEKTLAYAEEILENPNIGVTVKTDAQINKARAALALNKLGIAEKSYKEVAKTATNEIGAEAIYQLAKFNTDNSKFEASNVYVQQLAKDFSSYREYGAKGLILMAKNFYGLEDAYQATYVLSSLIKNFKEFPQVVAEAEALLETIKAEQAKVNSSIKE